MKQKLVATAFAIFLVLTTAAQSRTIIFSGYQWDIRPSEQNGGPGPNRWDENNVFLDDQGYLHLKLTQHNGKWYCSELYTQQALGFGLYQFSIFGRVDTLDRNVVFGLFNYPEPDVGPDGTNEIDIEFAHWGDPSNPIDNFTIFPAEEGVRPTSVSFPLMLRGLATSTHTFNWTPTSILFQSFGSRKASGEPLVSYLFRPRNASSRIPQSLLPVHINLWLFEGLPPADGQEVELIVRSFTYTPM